MFQAGEYVVYGCKGIHKITEITTLNIEGISRDREYYVMQAADKAEGSVYAPVDAERLNMRSVMSEQEARHFLDCIRNISPLDIKNNKQREDAYKACIRSCDPDELLRVIKTLYLRRNERRELGKKLTLTDLHYMQQAEDILFQELSIALRIPREEIPEKIERAIICDTARAH